MASSEHFSCSASALVSRPSNFYSKGALDVFLVLYFDIAVFQVRKVSQRLKVLAAMYMITEKGVCMQRFCLYRTHPRFVVFLAISSISLAFLDIQEIGRAHV